MFEYKGREGWCKDIVSISLNKGPIFNLLAPLEFSVSSIQICSGTVCTTMQNLIDLQRILLRGFQRCKYVENRTLIVVKRTTCSGKAFLTQHTFCPKSVINHDLIALVMHAICLPIANNIESGRRLVKEVTGKNIFPPIQALCPCTNFTPFGPVFIQSLCAFALFSPSMPLQNYHPMYIYINIFGICRPPPPLGAGAEAVEIVFFVPHHYGVQK